MSLEIVKVEGKRDLWRFVTLPERIYADDPMWVPPLRLERFVFLSGRDPFFHHAEVAYWLALRDGSPVGRISAQVDRLYLDHHGEPVGFWGMIEAEDDEAIFEGLLDVARDWLKERGMEVMRGPFNLSINQECGLLVKGFNTPPYMMMGHARPYYASRIEEAGFAKAKDLLAYSMSRDERVLSRVRRLVGRIDKKGDGFTTRPLDRRRLEAELDVMFSIFNDAWSNNWGFIPFTRDEYLHMGKSMNLLADPNLVRIAEVSSEAVGFIAVLPNLNEVLAELEGRLFPLGWLRLLHRIKTRDFRSARVVLMGVKRRLHDTMLGAAVTLGLLRDVIDQMLSTKIEQVELSWILEDNMPMRRIIESLGADPYKTYRIYEREIA